MKLSRQNLIYGLAGLLVLQIIILCFLYLFNFQSNKTRSIDKKLMANISEKTISDLCIADYMDSFNVKKEGNGGWIVQNKDGNIMTANVEKLKNYINDLTNINCGTVVATNSTEEIDSRFGFDEKNKQDLTITVGNKKYTITIGNNGSKRGTSYIKFNGEKKIREVNSSIATETANDPLNWARRSIVNGFTDKDIQNYALDSKLSMYAGSYSFTAKDSNTKDNSDDAPDIYKLDAPVGYKLSDYVMQHLVKEFLTMKCSEFKFNASLAGKEKQATIKVTLKNNQVHTFDVYQADADDIGDYIIDTDADDFLYLIHEDDLKKVIKQL